MNGELSYHNKRLGNDILNEACNLVIVGLKVAKGFELFFPVSIEVSRNLKHQLDFTTLRASGILLYERLSR